MAQQSLLDETAAPLVPERLTLRKQPQGAGPLARLEYCLRPAFRPSYDQEGLALWPQGGVNSLPLIPEAPRGPLSR
jgi:hypothetical protein